MPPNDGNTLGSANVKITGDITDLSKKVDEAKAKVEEVGKTTQDAAKTSAQAWDEIAGPGLKRNKESIERIRAATEAAAKEAKAFVSVAASGTRDVSNETKKYADELERAGKKANGFGRSLQKSVNSVTGVAAAIGAAIISIKQAVEAVFEFIDAKFGDGSKVAAKFVDALSAAGAEERLRAITKRISEVQKELQYANDNPLSPLGRGKSVIEGELKELVAAEESLRAGMLVRQGQKEKVAAQKAADDKQKIQEGVWQEEQNFRISMIKDETDREVAEIMEKRRLLREEEKKDGVSRFLLQNMLAAKAAQLIRDRDEKIRQEREGDEREAYEERMEAEEKIAAIRLRGIVEATQALQRMYELQQRGFDGNSGNNSLVGSIKALELTVRTLAGRVGG